MDIRSVIADLLALPLEQFTQARNARAKALKQEGQGDVASEVFRLRRPTVHLWAANRVARNDPAALRTLRDSARAVAKAQTGSGSSARDLRTASEAFQAALDGAVKAAEDVLQKNGHPASEQTRRQLREIFRLAAVQGGSTWEHLEKGALITEPSAEEDVLSMFQASAQPSGARRREATTEEPEDPHAVRAAERAARMDAERAEQLDDVARRLRAEADAAAEQAKRADERARAAEKQAGEARRQAARSARRLATR